MSEENYKIDWLSFDVEPVAISRATNSIVAKVNGRQNRYTITSYNSLYVSARQPFVAATTPNEIVVISGQSTRVYYARLTIALPSELKYHEGNAYVNKVIEDLRDNYPVNTVRRNSHYQNIFWFLVKAEALYNKVAAVPPKRQITISPGSYSEKLFRVAIFAWRDKKPPIAAAFMPDRQYSFFHSSVHAIQSAAPVVAFNNWRSVNCAEIDHSSIYVSDMNVYAVKYHWLLANIGYLETNLPEDEWNHIEEALNLD